MDAPIRSAGTDLIPVLSEFMAESQPLGLVFPPRADAPNLPDIGGREAALRQLRRFFARLPFMRTMDGPPQAFRVPPEQIHVYQPDDSSVLNTLPYIAFVGARSDNINEDDPLGPAIEIEDSADVYAPDTSLFYLGSHTEVFTIDVVADKQAILRAIVEGIKQVLRSSDDSAALRLRVPEHYDQLARFTLSGVQYWSDQYAIQNRRKAQLFVELYFDEVGLFNTVVMRNFLTVRAQMSAPDLASVTVDR